MKSMTADKRNGFADGDEAGAETAGAGARGAGAVGEKGGEVSGGIAAGAEPMRGEITGRCGGAGNGATGRIAVVGGTRGVDGRSPARAGGALGLGSPAAGGGSKRKGASAGRGAGGSVGRGRSIGAAGIGVAPDIADEGG